MATRRAVANGNWSATGTWNGGVVPTNGDTVYANGFNVTLDVDVLIGGANNPIVNTGSLVSGQWYEIVNVGGQTWTTLGAASNTTGTAFQSTGTGTAGNLGTARALATLTTATNTAAGATTGGGVFTMSTVRAMTADLRAGTTTCLNVTATTGTLIFAGRANAGTASGAHALNNSSTAVVEISGTFIGPVNTSNCFALNNASNGTINATGICVFSANTNGIAFQNSGALGIVNISASSTFIGGSNAGHAFNNSSTGTVNVTASCTFIGGSAGSAAHGLQNNSSGSVNISAPCTFSASTGFGSFALNNNSTGPVIITNSTFTASAFSNAVNIANTSADVRLSGDFLDHWSGWKAVSGGKWRLGTAPTLGQTRYALAGTTDSYYTMYGADNGSFGNPIAANVRSGVSYGGGNLTGTCAVPAAGSVALGVPVDAGYGTAVLTPQAVWGHASRTITEGGITAADVWNAASRTITGGTVTTLTNAPTVPSAAAIASQVRSELSVELGRIDAATSTRATPANIPTSEISAIKGKTDLLNTTRLAQVSTTEILGNLLAQANS